MTAAPAMHRAALQRNAARRLEQRVALALIVVPTMAAVLGAVLVARHRVSLLDLALCGGMYVASSLGVTAGYHRLFAHKAFTAAPALRLVLGIAGGMAAQGPLLFWVSHHRQHHAVSDQEGDPHSPHRAPAGPLQGARGFFHAHMGWTLDHDPEDWVSLVLDLMRDRAIWRVHALYPWWVLSGIALPALLGGLASWSWGGAASGLLWGGPIRIFLQYHATQSVNSIGHLWGARDFETNDQSRNNALCAAVALGEGWHNNHHAFPSSARHGLSFWQLDATWVFLRVLAAFGWARDLRAPGPKQLEKRRARLMARPRQEEMQS